eukprot:1456737-Heterocapsa_arctica.AAC.1
MCQLVVRASRITSALRLAVGVRRAASSYAARRAAFGYAVIISESSQDSLGDRRSRSLPCHTLRPLALRSSQGRVDQQRMVRRPVLGARYPPYPRKARLTPLHQAHWA